MESTPAVEQCKTCKTCGESKPLADFYRKRATCKQCLATAKRERMTTDPEYRDGIAKAQAKWLESNREKSRERCREYYWANREHMIAEARKWQAAHPIDPEARRRYERERYAANKDRLNAVDAAWREANIESVREARRRISARRRARIRGLPTERYTLDQIVERDGVRCVLCYADVDMRLCSPEPGSPTVEHLECLSWPDSAGDVLTNVALAHRSCNIARGTRPHHAAARKRAELLAVEATTT